mgnify:CR=1 FL=1
MRHIQKTASPDFFEAERATLPIDATWDDLHCKRALKQVLVTEQGQLCGYCESQITPDDSHIEHVMAQSEQEDLRFDYHNLIASCNGVECNPSDKNTYKPEDVHSCGHKKSNDMDARLFLNPITCVDISNYFDFDPTTGNICPSHSDASSNAYQKANYTINLLNLDNSRLNNARLNAKGAFRKAVSQYHNKPSGKSIKEVAMRLLNKQPAQAFDSFLHRCFIS